MVDCIREAMWCTSTSKCSKQAKFNAQFRATFSILLRLLDWLVDMFSIYYISNLHKLLDKRMYTVLVNSFGLWK